MQRINISYVNYFNHKYQQIGHLFQDRFKSEPIENENYLLAVLKYIHSNPIQVSLVSDIMEYPWCSYHSYIDTKVNETNSILDKDDVLSLFSTDKDKAIECFIKYHNNNETNQYASQDQ